MFVNNTKACIHCSVGAAKIQQEATASCFYLFIVRGGRSHVKRRSTSDDSECEMPCRLKLTCNLPFSGHAINSMQSHRRAKSKTLRSGLDFEQRGTQSESRRID